MNIRQKKQRRGNFFVLAKDGLSYIYFANIIFEMGNTVNAYILFKANHFSLYHAISNTNRLQR